MSMEVRLGDGKHPRLRSSDFAAFVKMMQAMLEVWKREGRVPDEPGTFWINLVAKRLWEPASVRHNLFLPTREVS